MGSYSVRYQTIKNAYDLNATTDINRLFTSLTTAIDVYENIQNPTPDDATRLKNSLDPITAYYTSLQDSSSKLIDLLDKAAAIGLVSDVASKERYDERQHPEETIKPRAMFYGILPTLHVRSLPLITAAGVFMAAMSIFLVFQLFGLNASISLPPALAALAVPSPPGSLPFYMNPMVIGGIIAVLTISTVTMGALYYKSTL